VTNAGSGSDRRRGRVCRATLAVALSARATDALRQRLSPRVSRSGKRASDRRLGASDGRARDASIDRFHEMELTGLRPS
jgi:hypothetical protein